MRSAPEGDALGVDLEAAGDRAARDLALGEAVGEAGEQRLNGLKDLQAAIDSAPNARAVLDLQARAATEQAMIANDQMRLQGLAMAQAAEDRLQTQRDQERARAASAARMALYRGSFE
jgi:type IV secretion system protein VirB5